MLILDRILGHDDEPRFADRLRDRLDVRASDAGRRRLRARTEGGRDVAIDLPRRGWLAHGSVLHDDGRHLIVVVRPPEPVMIVAYPSGDAVAALRIGHALGNQHLPVVLDAGGLATPVRDTPELSARPVLALGIAGVQIRFAVAPFAPDAPPDCAGAGHD